MSGLLRMRAWVQAIVVIFAVSAVATAASADDRETKGLFLYNLAKYVTWPAESFASDTAPIVIGIVDDAEFAARLDAIVDGHKAQGRSIRVMELAQEQSAQGVHIVYVPPKIWFALYWSGVVQPNA